MNVFVDLFARRMAATRGGEVGGGGDSAGGGRRAPARPPSTSDGARELTACDSECGLRATPCPDCGRCASGGGAGRRVRGRHDAVIFRWFVALTLHNNVELRKYRKPARSTRIS